MNMAGRKLRKVKTLEKTCQDASTQTSPEMHIVEEKEEIKRLKTKMKLLEEEFERWKLTTGSKEAVTVIAAADSPQPQKILGKGCQCKGKCMSKACGCVKRNSSCSAFCKCQSTQCKNQDGNKENNPRPNSRAELSSEAENSLKPQSLRKLRNRIMKEVTVTQTSPSNEKSDQVSQQSEVAIDSKKRLRYSDNAYTSPARNQMSATQSESDKWNRRRSLSPYRDVNHRMVSETPKKTLTPRTPVMNESTDEAYTTIKSEIFDPMKPTRQLQRTPVSLSASRISTSIFDTPPPNPKPSVDDKEIVATLPKEIHEPQVDWEEHCKQLVPCKRCKRKFIPQRLNRHESICKGN